MDPSAEQEVLDWLRATQARGFRRYLKENPAQLAVLALLPLMLLVLLPLLLQVPYTPVAPDHVDLGPVALAAGLMVYMMGPLAGGMRGGMSVVVDAPTLSVVFPAPLRRETWVRSNFRRAVRDVLILSLGGAALATWWLTAVVTNPVVEDFLRALLVLLPALLLWCAAGTLLGYAAARSRRRIRTVVFATAVPALYALLLFFVLDSRLALRLPPFSSLAWVADTLAQVLVGAPLGWEQILPLGVTGGVALLLTGLAYRWRYELPGPVSEVGLTDPSGLTQERAQSPGRWRSLRLRLRPRMPDLGAGWWALAALRWVSIVRGPMILLFVMLPVVFLPTLSFGSGGLLFGAVFGTAILPLFGTFSMLSPVQRDQVRSLPIPPRRVFTALAFGPFFLYLLLGAIVFLLAALAGEPILGAIGGAYLLSFPFVSSAALFAGLGNVSPAVLGSTRIGSMLGFVESFGAILVFVPIALSRDFLTATGILAAAGAVNLLLAFTWYQAGVRAFDVGPPGHLRPFVTSN